MLCSLGESLVLQTNQMKVFNSISAAVVLGGSLIATANPAIAYPSVTQICSEVRVELAKGVDEGRFKRQQVERMLLRCRDNQGVSVMPLHP